MSSSLLSLLFWVGIGLLFFWLMRRGGCGMGHGRGHGEHRDRTNGPAARSGKPTDPVCGMEVDPASATSTRAVAGETYFFCSQTCLEAFDKDPPMYTRAREQPRHREQRSHQHAGC